MTIPNGPSVASDSDGFDENLRKNRISINRPVTRSHTKKAALQEAHEKKKIWKKTHPAQKAKMMEEEKIEDEWENVDKMFEDKRMKEMANAYINWKRFIPTSIPFMRGKTKRKRKRRRSSSSSEDDTPASHRYRQITDDESDPDDDDEPLSSKPESDPNDDDEPLSSEPEPPEDD